MNFLAPWFLLGALAVAAPVLFHLIRRSARERTEFSSHLFLRPTPPRATRRRKLEHVLLMLLRCLAILLLAAGFARPFFPQGDASPPAADGGHQTVILIDTSASMRREGLWAEARSRTMQYVNSAGMADRVAVQTFDQQPRTLVSFSDWSSWPLNQRAALAGKILDAVSPGWGGTHLGAALTGAAELFPDTASGSCDVVLITDLQEGAKLDGLQGYDWPKNVHVIIERVDPKHRGNTGLEILNADNGRQARVRVVNSIDSDQEKFQIGWAGSPDKPMEIYLPPGQARTLAGPNLPAGAATGELRLTGATGDFDNTAWFAPAEIQRATIAYFGSESANDPQQLRYYLQRAFPDTALRQVEVVAASNSVALPGAALAVIPATLDDGEARAVRGWMTNGGTALLVLTNAENAATLAALADATNIEAAESVGDYALLGELDFTHPIFAAFADPRFSDFSRIHFWKHRRLTFPANVPVRILAKFDDDAPALAQIAAGKGNLLVLAAGWNPADSQLALSSKFLPLMQTILDWTGGAPPARTQFQIGEPIRAPMASGDAVQWRKPDGSVVSLAAGTPFTAADVPGIYSATVGASVQRFAVNLPSDEIRTAPMSPDDLGRLGVPLHTGPTTPITESTEAKRRVLVEEMENRQKLWRWLIAGILALALVEIVLGGWLSRRVTTLEAAA